MRRSLYRFCLSAFLYWFVSTCAGALLVIPEQIIRCAAFLLPVLGLMWGPVSAAGAYVGGLLTLPELKEFLFGSQDIVELLLAFGREAWILLAGWLPCLLWNKALKNSVVESAYAQKIPRGAVHYVSRDGIVPSTCGSFSGVGNIFDGTRIAPNDRDHDVCICLFRK